MGYAVQVKYNSYSLQILLLQMSVIGSASKRQNAS